MTVRSPNERDLVDRQLARVWQEFTPAPNLQQQVRARLTSSTAATMGAVGMGVASQARPEGAWASLQATGKLGALVGAGLLGAGVLSGYLIRDIQGETEQRETAPQAAMVQRIEASGDDRARAGAEAATTSERPAPEDSDDQRVPSGALEAPRAAAAPRAPRARPSRAQSHTLRNEPPLTLAPTHAASAAGNVSEELMLLQRAERAVRADNPALALALIGELEERYPRSIVLEERRAVELMAYCLAGATDASARTQRFLRDHPRSVHAGRIGEVCPSETGAPAPRRSQTSGTPDTESVKESP
jgi:hypothetical protein